MKPCYALVITSNGGRHTIDLGDNDVFFELSGHPSIPSSCNVEEFLEWATERVEVLKREEEGLYHYHWISFLKEALSSFRNIKRIEIIS